MKVGDLVRIKRASALTHDEIALIIELCAPCAARQNDVWRIQLCNNTLHSVLGSQLLFLTKDLEIVSEGR